MNVVGQNIIDKIKKVACFDKRYFIENLHFGNGFRTVN